MRTEKAMDMTKNRLVEALKNTGGIIAEACRKVGVSRQTYYNYVENDEDFKATVDEIVEENIDIAESSLLKNIIEGKETSVIFFLKTKGKARGYDQPNVVVNNSNSVAVQNKIVPTEVNDEHKRRIASNMRILRKHGVISTGPGEEE